MADLPFMSYQVSAEDALRNAGRFVKESLVEAVKLEGGESVCPTVKRIVEAGIPVMGHLGLTPQSIHQFGSYKARGVSDDEARAVQRHANALGRRRVRDRARKDSGRPRGGITGSLAVPTIGIGAGAACDGQILVTPDMLGMFTSFGRASCAAMPISTTRWRRRSAYRADVRGGTFPSDDESY